MATVPIKPWKVGNATYFQDAPYSNYSTYSVSPSFDTTQQALVPSQLYNALRPLRQLAEIINALSVTADSITYAMSSITNTANASVDQATSLISGAASLLLMLRRYVRARDKVHRLVKISASLALIGLSLLLFRIYKKSKQGKRKRITGRSQ